MYIICIHLHTHSQTYVYIHICTLTHTHTRTWTHKYKFHSLGKTADGKVVIQRFKEMPLGAQNPAKKALPLIKPGDFIIGINSVRFDTFAECVAAIRGSIGAIEMELERDI